MNKIKWTNKYVSVHCYIFISTLKVFEIEVLKSLIVCIQICILFFNLLKSIDNIYFVYIHSKIIFFVYV